MVRLKLPRFISLQFIRKFSNLVLEVLISIGKDEVLLLLLKSTSLMLNGVVGSQQLRLWPWAHHSLLSNVLV